MYMNKRLKTAMLITPLAVTLVFTGCSGGGDDDRNGTDTVPKVDTTVKVEIPKTQEFVGIPAPSEMLGFLKMVSKAGHKEVDFLNPTSNMKKYTTQKDLALNFGVYSCDLTYCSVFGISSSANDYFKVVKTLGEEIGVSSVITPSLMKRAESNLKNADSLAFLADEIYYSSSELLESSEKGPTLALVIAGGYIESLYIAANVIVFDTKNPAVSRFADQEYNLDDIVIYMKKYQSDAGVAEATKLVEEVKALFDQIKSHSLQKAEKHDNHKFDGGTVLDITQEQFKAIGAKLKEVRNKFAQI